MKEKKKKQKDFDFAQHIGSAAIYVAKEYKPWQVTLLKYCQTVPLNEEKTGPADPKGWVGGLREMPAYKEFTKDEQKKVGGVQGIYEG